MDKGGENRDKGGKQGQVNFCKYQCPVAIPSMLVPILELLRPKDEEAVPSLFQFPVGISDDPEVVAVVELYLRTPRRSTDHPASQRRQSIGPQFDRSVIGEERAFH